MAPEGIPWTTCCSNSSRIFNLISHRALKPRITRIITINRTVAGDRSSSYFSNRFSSFRSFSRLSRGEWKQLSFAMLFQSGLWVGNIRRSTRHPSTWFRKRKWLRRWSICCKALTPRDLFWRGCWAGLGSRPATFVTSCVFTMFTTTSWFSASLLLIWTYETLKCVNEVFFGCLFHFFGWRFSPPWWHTEYRYDDDLSMYS